MAETGSWIQKLFTSRDRNTIQFDDLYGNLGNTFVGEVGRLWYNPDSNCLYVSDGNTPGGIPLNTCGNVLAVANIQIYDEGSLISNRTASMNFVGAGITATAVGNAITITVPGTDTAFPVTVQDEGSNLTTAANLMNFVGAGVTATAVGNLITLTIPGSPTSGITVKDEGNLLTSSVDLLNFVGAGVVANATGNGVTVTIPGTTAVVVQDEGSLLTATANTFNFTGTGVTASNVGNVITVNVPTPTVYPLTVADEGSNLTTAANSINFVGNGVVATNSGNAVTVTVSGAGGISELYYGAFHFNSTTTLTAAMNSNSTDPIQVVSTTGFSNSGYIRIGPEVIAYTGKTATTFTGITRGVAGSNGSNHSIGDGVSQAQVTAAGVPAQVLIDVTDLSYGVTLDSATGNVTIANDGVYNMQFSAQIENFGNDIYETVVWFKINGNAVPATATYCSAVAIHGGTPGQNVMTVNIFYDITAGDVVALAWTSSSGTTTLSSIAPVGSTIPQSPGIILTVNRIS
jgi:hypothetical protein